MAASRYLRFTRPEWAALRADTPLTLSEADLGRVRGLNERVSLDEVTEVYLPLSRLLHLAIGASKGLGRAMATFLGRMTTVPYLLGLAGSVAVGKSTTARILQELLARWPDHPRVDLVATDGFLHPTRILEERGIMHRKGFPESYNLRALIRFLEEVKAGVAKVQVPVYSHLTYDIVPDEFQVVDSPDVVIVEGLNILQTGGSSKGEPPRVFASDFFDFTIYVDANRADIRAWYIERFLSLRSTAFRDPLSYFHRYADLGNDEAITVAGRLWEEINERNLLENILPTRDRANLILEKGHDHAAREVRLRKS